GPSDHQGRAGANARVRQARGGRGDPRVAAPGGAATTWGRYVRRGHRAAAARAVRRVEHRAGPVVSGRGPDGVQPVDGALEPGVHAIPAGVLMPTVAPYPA